MPKRDTLAPQKRIKTDKGTFKREKRAILPPKSERERGTGVAERRAKETQTGHPTTTYSRTVFRQPPSCFKPLFCFAPQKWETKGKTGHKNWKHESLQPKNGGKKEPRDPKKAKTHYMRRAFCHFNFRAAGNRGKGSETNSWNFRNLFLRC
jgi:hypothetical protein